MKHTSAEDFAHMMSNTLEPSRSCGERFTLSTAGRYWQETGQRFAVKCVKRADLPPGDEADLKMEVKLLQEVPLASSQLTLRRAFATRLMMQLSAVSKANTDTTKFGSSGQSVIYALRPSSNEGRIHT